MDGDDLTHRFAYHPPPDQSTAENHAEIRAECNDLADMVNALCPEGREKSLAITKIEEAMMWANAAIARGASR